MKLKGCPGSPPHRLTKRRKKMKIKKKERGGFWLKAFWPTFRTEHTAPRFCFCPLLHYPQDPSYIHAICSAHSLKSMSSMQEESTCCRLLLFLFIVCIIRPRRNPNNKCCLKHCVNIEQNYGLSQNDYKLNRGQETTDRSKQTERV